MLLGSLYSENETGVASSAGEFWRLREGDGFPIPLGAAPDWVSPRTTARNAMPQFATGTSTLHHVRWLQELLSSVLWAAVPGGRS